MTESDPDPTVGAWAKGQPPDLGSGHQGGSIPSAPTIFRPTVARWFDDAIQCVVVRLFPAHRPMGTKFLSDPALCDWCGQQEDDHFRS